MGIQEQREELGKYLISVNTLVLKDEQIENFNEQEIWDYVYGLSDKEAQEKYSKCLD